MKKTVIFSCLAALFCACAAGGGSAASASAGSAAAASGAAVEDFALGCFDLLLSGAGEKFYSDCVLQAAQGIAAQVRQGRWERIAVAAAKTVGARGGVLRKEAACRASELGADCKITYLLALEPEPREVMMPLVRDKLGQWKIYR